jgi:hypothetical protein
MNKWRWVGSFVLMTGLFLCVSMGLSVTGQEPGKDTPKKDEPKKDEPKKEAAPEPKKEPVAEPKKEAAPAGDAAWKLKAFDKDAKPFYQELTTKTNQTIKVMGQEVKQEQKQTFYVKWTPVSYTGDTIVVKEQIVGIKMNIDIGGNTISYDSVDTTSKNPMTDFFNALLKSDLTLTIDAKTLKVTEVKGASTLIENLSGTNMQLAPLLKSILSDDAIKQMTEPTWGAIPTTAVKKGESWNKSISLNLGGIGTYDTKYIYTLESEDSKEAKVGIKADLTYVAPTDKKSLPFKIISADLKSTKATGSATFNKDKGRIESCDMEMVLGGKLNIEISGMTAEVTLDQTQTSSVRTTDTDPVPAATPKKS